MSLFGRSLMDVESLSLSDVHELFDLTKKFASLHKTQQINYIDTLQKQGHHFIALIFLEPSTRTRGSFEAAAHKLGIKALCPEFGASSSRIKGESAEDTFLTILAMEPSLVVVRYGDIELNKLLEESPVPVISGGCGTASHPTQALLDAYTMQENLGELSGKKVFIVGDVRHSRVAQSNMKLLKMLGVEVSIGGPEEWVPQGATQKYRSIEEGLEWADVVMALRIQWERHGDDQSGVWTKERYHKEFGIDKKRLALLGDGIFMHPGPANHGVEATTEVLRGPRSRVIDQVRNGVYIRAALLGSMLGVEF